MFECQKYNASDLETWQTQTKIPAAGMEIEMRERETCCCSKAHRRPLLCPAWASWVFGPLNAVFGAQRRFSGV